MGKRMWLSLFVLSGFLSVGAVVGGTNPFDYLGNKETAEVYNDQDEPQPEVKVGKPHNIIQALPKNDTSGNFRVYLGDAIKEKFSGSTIDSEGNAIVPIGYVYSFHNTFDEATRNINKVSEIMYIDRFNPASAPLTRFIRVQSVVDTSKISIESFLIEVKPEEGALLKDRVTGRPDQYKSADANGNASFVLSEDRNLFYYGNIDTELFKVDGASKVKLSEAEIRDFVINRNQVIEAVLNIGGDIAVRQFTLHVEKLRISGVNPILESIETRRNGTARYGTFNLKNSIPGLLAVGENPDYYNIVLYRTLLEAQNNENPININIPFEGEHGTDVTARISYKLAKAPVLLESFTQKMVFNVADKPRIPKLENITLCDSDITTYSSTIAGQTRIIADGRTIATDEEIAAEGFDPTGKFSIGYFNSELDAISNTNKIVGVEITVNLNEARPIWTRLTNLEDGNFNTAMFYVSLGYDTLRTDSFSFTYNYCQDELSDPTKHTVNLGNLNSLFIGKLNTDVYGPSFNPEGAHLTVVYYKDEDSAKMDIRMPTDSVNAFPINMGEKKGPFFARVIMKEGFGCMADNYSSFTISLSTSVKVAFEPENSHPQLCINTETNKVTPILLSVENKDVANRSVVVTWKKIKMDNDNNPYWATIQTGKLLFLNVEESGEYSASVSFEEEPYSDAVSCGMYREWKVIAPPVLEVQDADAKGMINSMEIDEKGYTPIELSIVGGNNGDYEFALDNGGFQQSNQFYNVPIGDHSVRARNKTTGCATSATFSVFGFPKYFTPNGDGYNDTWNIPGLKGHQEARIYIYDKSGRLLKQLSPFTEGWDGTWNGKAMPSTDYWFTVEFVNDYKAPNDKNGQKVSYKGHFSLKR